MEVKEGGWCDVGSDTDDSLIGENVKVTNVDSKDGWDSNSGHKFSVQASDACVNESLEFGLESGGVHSEGGGKVRNGSDGIKGDVSEDLSALGSKETSEGSSIEGSLDLGYSSNCDGDSKVNVANGVEG